MRLRQRPASSTKIVCVCGGLSVPSFNTIQSMRAETDNQGIVSGLPAADVAHLPGIIPAPTLTIYTDRSRLATCRSKR